jgi:hypothetical protein
MSYRDDQEAARHRLESLEEKLAERDAELEQHKDEIAERDREIARLARELRTAGTARIVAPRRNSAARFVVAGAMSSAVIAGMIGFLSVHRAATREVTFADFPPPTMPLAAPRTDSETPTLMLADPLPDAVLGAEAQLGEREQARQLLDKVVSGTYSREELQRLSQLCKRLGKNCGQSDERRGIRPSE